ncbi:hypothetical protein ACQ9LF_05945 [Anaerohalosphaeraceae bacterium U12dextr]
MIQEVQGWFPERPLRVVADGFDACLAGRRLPCPEKMAAYVHDWKPVEFRLRSKRVKRLVDTRLVLWYAVSRKPFLLVICRDPAGKEKDDFFFTNDVTMSAAEVLDCYGDRWAIKDSFKNTMQLLGGQQP